MSQPTMPQRDRQDIDYQRCSPQKLDDLARREVADRRIAIQPFSSWVLVVCGLAFFFAGFFSGRHGIEFAATRQVEGDLQSAVSASQAVETATAASATQTTGMNADASGVAHVIMKNMQFSPATIDIKRGATVEWKNADITPHTATSATFDSGPIDSDKSWRHAFSESGSFPYACTFHPEMKAVVKVK
jgi:plastocyanin